MYLLQELCVTRLGAVQLSCTIISCTYSQAPECIVRGRKFLDPMIHSFILVILLPAAGNKFLSHGFLIVKVTTKSVAFIIYTSHCTCKMRCTQYIQYVYLMNFWLRIIPCKILLNIIRRILEHGWP